MVVLTLLPNPQDNRRAYGFTDGGKGKGDYSSQQKAWDCSVNANDGPNVLNYTLWTYVPNNSHRWGDNWNGEDLSLWSADDQRPDPTSYRPYQMRDSPATSTTALMQSPSMASSRTLAAPTFTPKGIQSGVEVTPKLILDGARVVAAICRPYPVATVGVPERIDFDIKSTTFKLSVRVSPQDSAGQVTEIYVPFVHYAAHLDWDASSLSRESSQVSLTDTPEATTKSDPFNPARLELDIVVKTSVGSFTTEGQYLRWTYPIPANETVYTIEIKRNGGALAVHNIEPEPTWADIFASYLGCTIS